MMQRQLYTNYALAERDARQMAEDEGKPFAVIEEGHDGWGNPAAIFVLPLVEAVAYCELHDAEYGVPEDR